MTRHVVRTRTEGYGVAVEVRMECSDTATEQEVARAACLALSEVKAAHATSTAADVSASHLRALAGTEAMA